MFHKTTRNCTVTIKCFKNLCISYSQRLTVCITELYTKE